MTDYTLHIDAYSPETIPMSRLAEYMHGLADLLGHKESVHFEGLEPGSTRLKVRIEKEAVPKVVRDLHEVGTGNGTTAQDKAWQRLDDMLADDNASGTLLAGEIDQRSIVIQFPGATAPKPQTFGPIRQAGALQGLLVRIGGADATVHLLIQNGDVSYSNIVCDRGMARDLAKHLFDPVRIHGEGRWLRDRNGDWLLKSFRVHRFDALKKGSIRDALDQLNLVKDADLDTSEMDQDTAEIVHLRRDES